MLTVRREQLEDVAAAREVNRRALGQAQEAKLVDRPRQKCPEGLSLAAVDGDDVIGHILFTPVIMDADGRAVEGMGQGPMAVLARHGRR